MRWGAEDLPEDYEFNVPRPLDKAAEEWIKAHGYPQPGRGGAWPLPPEQWEGLTPEDDIDPRRFWYRPPQGFEWNQEGGEVGGDPDLQREVEQFGALVVPQDLNPFLAHYLYRYRHYGFGEQEQPDPETYPQAYGYGWGGEVPMLSLNSW
jgi:hypothetical protein